MAAPSDHDNGGNGEMAEPSPDKRVLVVTIGGRHQTERGGAPVCVEFGMCRITDADAKAAGLDTVLRTIAAAAVRGAEWVMAGDAPQSIVVAGQLPPDPPPMGRA